ncbi:hypothetical protein FJV41_47355 [Myxococcus llanfairpwllgwyngyllgogerychwyrndrobwllllantysiliogogogochensis]|uniref:Uncharacterized protein n=1 Tax=Myxococcus llanfairpwllgwyngyllgogerychwyrndrobwllllantysiliogogogochensis TaxID=2590453 RepID=A0A540WIQ8_9BACT|nr:hypothetical protein [Myxococcus llanfairpwllgwyngyllgogerychwyrndrobwllllantysiliogogogochensis]TQF08915.1 hypothetical protein FJV41_47355 [Myxococcus llanfairpwllgwyngyllgogerychwyrndrobwllllantysiliogogogochensis]
MTDHEETENDETAVELAVLRLMTEEEWKSFLSEVQPEIDRLAKDQSLSASERRSTVRRIRYAQVIAAFQRAPNATPYVHMRERLPEWEP